MTTVSGEHSTSLAFRFSGDSYLVLFPASPASQAHLQVLIGRADKASTGSPVGGVGPFCIGKLRATADW